MGLETAIQWCDSTVNPTTGCDGCELWSGGTRVCYAGRLHESRLRASLPRLYGAHFTTIRLAPGRMRAAAAWPDLRGAARPGKPWLDGRSRFIFISDMADALSEAVPFSYLADEVIEAVRGPAGRRHVWLWLTKRPGRMSEFAEWLWAERAINWPMNLWVGTSVTSRGSIDRIRDLEDVPAERRFVSVEPLWAPFDWTRLQHVHWVIVGGQSGPDASRHALHLEWLIELRDWCRLVHMPLFVKQLGSAPRYRGLPLPLRDSHGGDPREWPAAVGVLPRELPSISGWEVDALQRPGPAAACDG